MTHVLPPTLQISHQPSKFNVNLSVRCLAPGNSKISPRYANFYFHFQRKRASSSSSQSTFFIRFWQQQKIYAKLCVSMRVWLRQKKRNPFENARRKMMERSTSEPSQRKDFIMLHTNTHTHPPPPNISSKPIIIFHISAMEVLSNIFLSSPCHSPPGHPHPFPIRKKSRGRGMALKIIHNFKFKSNSQR